MKKSREWVFRDGPSNGEAKRLAELVKETGFSPVTLKVCMQRGMSSAEEIQKFLYPKLQDLTSPFKLKDMGPLVHRLSQARQDGEKVRIFGDYDVDGTAGASLLKWFFREIELDADVRQPNRFKDGYGLNVGAVEEAKRDGVDVLLTVDCGATSFEAADRAAELGIVLMILDHHQLDQGRIPESYAFVNPQRPDCESDLKQLCGCGLAFYACMALRSLGKKQGWLTDVPNLRKHLDLVVIATAADIVPLTGDNHILVRHGLEVLKKTEKPGVRALMEAAGVSGRTLSPGHLGFVLGPRINASGRLETANHALRLLTTQDEVDASELALALEKLNHDRQKIQNEIWDDVKEEAKSGIEDGRFQHGIVVASEGWHEGVVGIVASRVTETFHLPAIVISITDGKGKGSVRTFGGKNVLEAVRAGKRHLLGFGGHKHAAGLSLNEESIEAFTQDFNAALAEIPEDRREAPLYLEGECDLSELSYQVFRELEQLGPFGPGNPEPVFSVQAGVRDKRVLKERHLKLNLGPVGQSRGPTVEAIWFHGVERTNQDELTLMAENGKWAAVPELNRFRDRVTPTLRIRDFQEKDI